MTQTLTRTSTYTKVDIAKTLESFRSVLRLISMSTGCDNEIVDARADDIVEYAYAGYLSGVDVILRDAAGTRIRIARFTASENASGWSTDMPGDNIWPATANGSLSLVALTTDAWKALSGDQRAAFWNRLTLTWGPAKTESNLADMEAVGSRRYSSNAYGLEQTTFKRKGGA